MSSDRFTPDPLNEVVVGNVGTVYSGRDSNTARTTFLDYRALSFRGEGSAAHETVTWLRNGDIYKEFIPEGEQP